MKATVGEILKEPDKYVECRSCGYINWHGNQHCKMCDNNSFLPLGKTRINGLKEALPYIGECLRPV